MFYVIEIGGVQWFDGQILIYFYFISQVDIYVMSNKFEVKGLCDIYNNYGDLKQLDYFIRF